MAQVEVVSIPGLVLAAAERFAEPGGARRRRRRCVRLTFPQLADEMRRSTRAADRGRPAARATGRRSGRPTSASGSSPRSGSCGAGGVLVPLNTRFKGAEAAYVLAQVRRPDAVHRHRLPRHRLRRAAARRGRGRCPALERDRRAPRRRARRHDAVGRLPGRAATRSPRPTPTHADRRGRRPTTSPTSSSRRARPAARRAR